MIKSSIKNFLITSCALVTLTISAPSFANEEGLILSPPQNIDFSACRPLTPTPDDKAKNLDIDNISKSSLSDTELFRIARLYKYGSGKTIPNIKKTRKILEYLTSRKSIDIKVQDKAWLFMGEMIREGDGYPNDKDKALSIFQDVLKRHREIALSRIGKTYRYHKQFAESVPIYKEALQYRDPTAALALANIYHNKRVPKSDNDTNDYIVMAQNMLLEKLASGDCNFLGQIATFYMDLQNLPHREKIAAQWFLLAANLDKPHYKVSLAKLIEQGFLDDIDNKPSSKTLWRDAANLGSAQAMFSYALILFEQNDIDGGLSWMAKAANYHNSKAIQYLIKYYDPKGDHADTSKYLHWLSVAAKQENPDANLLYRYATALNDAGRSDQKYIYNLFKRAGEAGNGKALFQMGEAHKHGLGVEKNPTKALRYYRLATQNSNLDAYEALANSYQCGIGKNIDNDTANEWLVRGEYYGLNILYTNLLDDYQNASNDDERRTVLESYIPKFKTVANEKNSPKAMIKLHTMYLALDDKGNADKWLNRALKLDDKKTSTGNTHNQYAKELMRNDIGTADPEKAMQFMEKAAMMNNKSALKYLGDLALDKNDIETAHSYYIKAYKAGDKQAALRLSKVAVRKKNYDSAIQYLTRAADRGDTKAMFALAKAYSNDGWMAPANSNTASEWFEKAVKNYICDLSDIMHIAQSYHKGRNGAQLNPEKAQYWFEKINFNQINSDQDKLKISKIFITSDDFKNSKNQKYALAYLNNQIEMGSIPAMYALSEFYLESNDSEQQQRGIDILQKLADKKDPKAMIQMAKYYIAGYRVERSIDKAITLLEEASTSGYEEAINLLTTIKE